MAGMVQVQLATFVIMELPILAAPNILRCARQWSDAVGTHRPRQQEQEDVKTLLRTLLKLKAAARRKRYRENLVAAAALSGSRSILQVR
jgi:hypothetical protein